MYLWTVGRLPIVWALPEDEDIMATFYTMQKVEIKIIEDIRGGRHIKKMKGLP